MIEEEHEEGDFEGGMTVSVNQSPNADRRARWSARSDDVTVSA
jgi:hypothetical protein